MEQFILLGPLTFVASSIGTLSGFGASTLMVPVLTLFFPLPVTLLFVGIIHFAGDIWKMLLFRSGFSWKLILGFGLPGIALSYVGARFAFDLPGTFLERLLGLFVLGHVFFIFIHTRWRLPRSTLTMVMGGALSGFFAGLFGIGGAIRGLFLSAFALPKVAYIFISGAIALVIDGIRLGTYLGEGIRLETHYTLRNDSLHSALIHWRLRR